MRIRTKISLFVIPLAILPLLLVGLFSYQSLLKGFEEQAYLDDQQLCLIAATRIEQALDESRDGTLLLSSLLSSKLNKKGNQRVDLGPAKRDRVEKLLEGDDNPIKEFARGLAIRYSPYLRIRLIAPDGKELFKTQGMTEEFELGSALHDPIFLQAVAVSVANRYLCQFSPVERCDDGKRRTTFSIPLYYGEGSRGVLMGFVFLDLDLEAFSKILLEMETTRPGYYFLFDGSGKIMAEAGGHLVSATEPDYEDYQSAVRQVLDNPQPGFTHTAYEAAGKRFFVSSRPVKEYIAFKEPIPEERWYLALVRSESPLLSAFRQSQIIFLIVLVFGLVIAIGGTFYISKRITTPISRLTIATERFARGNLDSSIEVTSRDEVGKLAADFNNMATDLRQLIRERQANEALIAIGRFSATLAHDLRNPVEGLKLLSRELSKRVGPERPEHEIADTIAQSVDRLSSLVNQSLDFARLTKPVFVATDLAVLADEVLKDFHLGEVQLTRDYAHDLPLVEVDAAQIKRVLSNLIRNALEACLSRGVSRYVPTSTKCQLSLTLSTRGEKVRIGVADAGPGIPLEIREKIFEPFFSTKPGGHGLGLALARQIVSNHGGTITFTSEVDAGTRFIIELPIAQRSSKSLCENPLSRCHVERSETSLG